MKTTMRAHDVAMVGGLLTLAAALSAPAAGVGHRGGKPVIAVEKQYGDIVPRGKVQQLFFDADGALWIVTDRLARITVPPATAQGRR